LQQRGRAALEAVQGVVRHVSVPEGPADNSPTFQRWGAAGSVLHKSRRDG
jgi:hypothetical protein